MGYPDTGDLATRKDRVILRASQEGVALRRLRFTQIGIMTVDTELARMESNAVVKLPYCPSLIEVGT